jgi:hypothetical protein
MSWIPVVMSGLSAVIQQWMGADEETRAQIEARALSAIRDMVADKDATASSHDARTAATLAVIDEAIAAKVAAQ